jgi:hypothetical protein
LGAAIPGFGAGHGSFPLPRGPELWGPAFELTPEFAKDTVALFGRQDFFETFIVTFKQPGGPVFHLDVPN